MRSKKFTKENPSGAIIPKLLGQVCIFETHLGFDESWLRPSLQVHEVGPPGERRLENCWRTPWVGMSAVKIDNKQQQI